MSPRSKEQNEKIRETRIVQIRQAAVSVYLEKGFQAAEVGDIAKKAGMARGLVYYYFKDKTELFRTVFRYYFDEAKQFVSQTLLTAEPPLERLERYARFYLSTAVTKPEFVRLYMNMQMDVQHVFGDEAKDVMADFITNIQEPLHRTMEEGIRSGTLAATDSKLLAHTFWGGITGALLELSRRGLTEAEARGLIDEALDILLRGIKR
jgi:TetR/AcrR family transcriptional regulator